MRKTRRNGSGSRVERSFSLPDEGRGPKRTEGKEGDRRTAERPGSDRPLPGPDGHERRLAGLMVNESGVTVRLPEQKGAGIDGLAHETAGNEFQLAFVQHAEKRHFFQQADHGETPFSEKNPFAAGAPGGSNEPGLLKPVLFYHDLSTISTEERKI